MTIREKMNSEEYNFHPGYYIRDLLDETDMDVYTLAKKLNFSVDYVIDILNCNRAVTPLLATELERVFHISYGTWMNLQKRYDEKKKVK